MNKKRKTSKRAAAIKLLVVLVLTVALALVGLNGAKVPFTGGLYKVMNWLPTSNAQNWPQVLSLGLDLKGGVYVEYTAESSADVGADFNDQMDGTVSIITKRLTGAGFPEATVQRLGTNGIRVEVPDVQDPTVVLEMIGAQAKMEFRDEAGNLLMDGSKVATAVANYDPNENDYVIAFRLTPEGAAEFADITAANIGKRIGIYLDDVELISPVVNSVIPDGSGVINGMGSYERAQAIAAQIQSGALPMVLTQQKVDTVSATLGSDALSTTVTAAVIGLLLVMLLMIVRYRMNGLVASWALVLYIIVLFLCLAVIPGVQLTLPGLAGIVLGIGMAVDANVVIYERFNEEVAAGRPVKAAVRAGFKNALSAILDANVTTLIAAVVLMIFGTGSIQGFATTLLLGVIVSMFTALVMTRFFMNQFSILCGNKKGLFISKAKLEKEVQA